MIVSQECKMLVFNINSILQDVSRSGPCIFIQTNLHGRSYMQIKYG